MATPATAATITPMFTYSDEDFFAANLLDASSISALGDGDGVLVRDLDSGVDVLLSDDDGLVAVLAIVDALPEMVLELLVGLIWIKLGRTAPVACPASLPEAGAGVGAGAGAGVLVTGGDVTEDTAVVAGGVSICGGTTVAGSSVTGAGAGVGAVVGFTVGDGAGVGAAFGAAY